MILPATAASDDDAQRDLATLARGGALNLVGAVATGLLHFVLLVVITRGLQAQGTGAFYEAVALFLILSSAAALGADVGLSRMVPRYRALGRAHDLRRGLHAGLWPVLAAGCLLGALAFGYAAELADVFSRHAETAQLTAFIRTFAVFIPVSALSLAVFAATRGFGTMRPTVYLDKIARPALQPLLILAAVLAGAGSTAIALAYLGPYLPALAAGLIWLGVLLRRAERPRDGAPDPPLTRPRSADRLLEEFWRFTGPRGLAAIFQTTSMWLNTLLIGALRSTKEAGVYAASTRYLAMGGMTAVAIRQVLAPKLSELLARRSQERAASAYQATTSWMVALNWPIYLALIAFGPVLLRVFGREFAGGQVVLVVLAVTMLVATVVGPVDVVLLMGGRSSWNLVNTLVALVANLALNFVLTPRYGLAGAAVALAVGILLNNLIPLVQVWRSMGLHPFGAGTGVAAALSAVSFGLVGLGARALLGPTPAGLVAYAAVGGGLYAALLWRFRDRLEWEALRGILHRRPRPTPRPSLLWRRVMERIEAGETAVEPVLDDEAGRRWVGPTVSGGRDSLVAWNTLGRQGRRHAFACVWPQQRPDRLEGFPDLSIETVMGEPAKATPIQVYVGLDSAPTVRERVELALAEMDRTGAWDRSVLMLVSPTGTGYVNYCATAAAQYLTRGDIATVTLQYSKRPSPLSLFKVKDAREQNRLLWLRISSRLRDRNGPRPLVVLFGEGLGAHTSQDVLLHWGTLGPQALGIDRALWIGTPHGSGWMHQVTGPARPDVDPDLVATVNDFGQIEALPAERRARLRYVLVSHDNDGVTKFGAHLLASRPAWLSPERPPLELVGGASPRGISARPRWRPVTTFLHTLVDMKNSQLPGAYRAWGHDYRPDLARFVAEVFNLPASEKQLRRVEAALEEQESIRARILSAESLEALQEPQQG